MKLLFRSLFVIVGIVAGSAALNHFVFGANAGFSMSGSRLGAWRDGKVRPACFPALTTPKDDRDNPTLPYGQHRIGWQDFDRVVDMTAALHCYLVTQQNAVCDRDNRAFVVDYIGKYFQKRDDMIAAAGKYGDDEVRMVRNLWDSRNNRAIMTALEAHLRYGRLNKADFGWSTPDALKAMLDQYGGAPDYCPKERPWVAVKM